MNKEIQNKIRACKALQGKTVADVINTERFASNLAAYWTAQKQDRAAIRASYQAMHKMGGHPGYKIPAHVIDDLQELTTAQFVKEFLTVVNGQSKRPAAERQYIKQLGQQAYNLTVAQYVVDEYPELKDTLLPKSKSN